MSPLRQFGQKAAWIALLMLLTTLIGCSHPAGVVGGARSSQPELPFNGEPATANTSSVNSSGHYLPAQNASTDPGSSVPFHDPHILPPGTLIMVRLDKTISTDALSATASFQATVEEPVIVEGVALVPKGATVVGRVESARASAAGHDHGYVRLTLASLAIGDQEFNVQTASLFARPTPGSPTVQPAKMGRGIRLDQGRSMTFRLTRAVEMAVNHPTPSQALAKPNF
jgi:hypothetical protein